MGVVLIPSLPAATDEERFEAILTSVERPLRRALVAAYGAEAGREAAADALAWAWEHLDRIEPMTNPAGYLWRVGQSAARRGRRWSDRTADVAPPDLPGMERDGDYEPALAGALRALTPRQRAAVLLVHGWGHSLPEAAAALGCSVSSLRNHLARGLEKLRTTMGVDDDRA